MANSNFGSGSSREGAVYALVDYGFRCVIAPSFEDILYFNALNNGLLAIRLPEDDVSGLRRIAHQRVRLRNSLSTCWSRQSRLTISSSSSRSTKRASAG